MAISVQNDDTLTLSPVALASLPFVNPESPPYNAPFDARTTFGVTLTNTSNVATGAVGKFQAADVGRYMSVSNADGSGTGFAAKILSVSITGDSATLNAPAIANRTGGVVIGTDITSQINQAFQDSLFVALPAKGFCHQGLRIRGGTTFVGSGSLNTLGYRVGGSGPALGMVSGQVAQGINISGMTLYCQQLMGATLAVSSVTGNGVVPIVVTTSAPHGLTNYSNVSISGVGGNTNANGVFQVLVLSPTTFSLQAAGIQPTGNGNYTTGGTVAVGLDGINLGTENPGVVDLALSSALRDTLVYEASGWDWLLYSNVTKVSNIWAQNQQNAAPVTAGGMRFGGSVVAGDLVNAEGRHPAGFFHFFAGQSRFSMVQLEPVGGSASVDAVTISNNMQTIDKIIFNAANFTARDLIRIQAGTQYIRIRDLFASASITATNAITNLQNTAENVAYSSNMFYAEKLPTA